MLSYKTILITGGTGSLGQALLKRARQDRWRGQITILARNETKMNAVHTLYPETHCEIGDVRDADWLRTIFVGQELIIHAAAMKIVPVAESSPREAVLTNVMGSLNVAQAAIDAGVRRVIGVSSDKVCGPTYYGLTKRLMEGLFRQAGDWGDTEFVQCRYGNVLGSSNSILPLFLKQKNENRPFTITDIRMSRFWMTMDQAIDLIIYADAHAKAGEIIIPKCPAAPLVSLAKAVDPDHEIVEIGIRPGERLHETLLIREESLHASDIGDYFIIHSPKATVLNPLPFQYEYTSDLPARTLTVEDLAEMIQC